VYFDQGDLLSADIDFADRMSRKSGPKAKAMAAAVAAQAVLRQSGALPFKTKKKKQIQFGPTRKAMLPSFANPSGGNTLGSYAPSARSTQQRPSGPRTVGSSQNSKRIVHRELIGSVVGSTAFTIQYGLALNPGIATTFPWLAGQAVFWEQYRFHGLRFEYVTRCGSSQAGSVIMTPDYDAEDTAPVTEANMSTYQDSVEDAPWKDIVTRLDPKAMHPMGPRKFIRDGNTSGDIKTFDVGTFFLATVDCGGTPGLGKLWVEYDVELFVPASSPAASAGARASSLFVLHANQVLTSGLPALIAWDTKVVDALRFNPTLPATGFVPPKGVYLVDATLSVRAGNATDAVYTLQFTKNGSNIPDTVSTAQMQSAAVNGAAALVSEFIITCNGTDLIGVSITATSGAGTLTALGTTGTVLFQNA